MPTLSIAHSFSLSDLVLIAVVTFISVGVAYVPSPRAKSMIYMLPLPFSAALMSTGKGVDATHLIGMLAVWGFVWLVWLFYTRWRIPILMADGLALVIHCIISLSVAHLIPRPQAGQQALEQSLFWGSTGVLFLLAGIGLFMPHRDEPHYRSLLPVAVKAPLIILLVSAIILLKEPLRGFMPAFPFVTVFAVYEARHSLYTLASRIPIMIMGFVFMLMVCRLLIPYSQPSVSVMLASLGLAWLAYLPVYFGMDWLYQRRAPCSKPILR